MESVTMGEASSDTHADQSPASPPHSGRHHLDSIAVSSVAHITRDQLGAAGLADLLTAAGLDHYINALPVDPVPEAEVTALHRALWTTVDPAEAAVIADHAGRRAAEMLIAERLPKAAKGLRFLPPAMAARSLMTALTTHGHLVTGSGTLRATPGHPAEITITNSPLCRGYSADAPVCSFYAALFEGIFQALISSDALVRETHCAAAGADECRFSVTW